MTMLAEAPWPSLAAALGLGLLIGVIRERSHPPVPGMAGIRTHALLGLLGALGLLLGPLPFALSFAAVAALNVASYRRSAAQDPGLTGEVAVIATFLLGGLATRDAPLASALGVLVAALLYAKLPLRRFSRDWLRDSELRDGLLLAAAALVVMPLLPEHAVDPWGALRPVTVWRIVVLVMAVGMLGHLAVRAAGPRAGLPLAGFFAGFASSTAAVASFGERARRDPRQTRPAAAAALLANLASLLLLIAVIGTIAPPLLATLGLPFAAAAASLVLLPAALLARRAAAEAETSSAGESSAGPAPAPDDRAFKPGHALGIALAISAVMLLSAWLAARFGAAGAIAAASFAALAELHAAGASLAQLALGGELDGPAARWALLAILAASALAKSVLALASGGRRYGGWVATGLALMLAAVALGALAGA